MSLIKLLIIFITTLFFYRKTVSYGYIIDDIEVSTHARTGKLWLDLWYQTRGHAYFNRRTEHTITLLFHTINSMLVFLAFGLTNIAFLAAMLFAVNPVNNQASVWLSGKVYSIATTCILLGLCLKYFFPALYFASFYFSLNGVLAPLLFAFVAPHWFVGLFLLLTVFYKQRLVSEPQRRYKQGSPWMKEISFRKLIICVKTYGYYFRLALFPFKLGMCHKYLHEYGLTERETEKWYTLDKYFWLGLGVLCFIPVGFLTGIDVFGLIWFTVLMAQWCNFIILNHPICERYVYLANVGLMYMLAKVLFTVPYGLYIAVGIFTYYVTRLWQFLPAYNNNLDYFASNKDNFGDVAISYNQKGLELIRHNRANEAVDTFMEGLLYRPFDFRLNYNIGNLLMGMGRFNDAKYFIYRADENLPMGIDNNEIWRNGIDDMKRRIKESGFDVN